jgi:hypothetical protein
MNVGCQDQGFDQDREGVARLQHAKSQVGSKNPT